MISMDQGHVELWIDSNHSTEGTTTEAAEARPYDRHHQADDSVSQLPLDAVGVHRAMGPTVMSNTLDMTAAAPRHAVRYCRTP